MPRRELAAVPEFVELQNQLDRLESKKLVEIAAAKNHILKTEREIEYLKSVAIIDAKNAGMSVYAITKAAGVKSSAKKATLISDCVNVIAKYRQEVEVENAAS